MDKAFLIEPKDQGDIIDKYGPYFESDNTSLGMGLGLDLYVMKSCVPHFYEPSKNPLVMVVGASEKEAVVAKKFHELEYNIINTRVFGCNKKFPRMIFPNSGALMDEYNEFVFEPEEGDATNERLWSQVLKSYQKQKYDLVYIRDPNILPETIDNWLAVYGQAISHLSEAGVVYTLISASIFPGYMPFVEALQQKTGQKPAFMSRTNIIGYDHIHFDDSSNWHTVSIYKP